MGEHHYHDEATERNAPKRAYELTAVDTVENGSQEYDQLESPHPRLSGVSSQQEQFDLDMDEAFYKATMSATD